MLDSIYYMTLKLLQNCLVGVKTSIFCHLLHNVSIDVITSHYEICKPLVVYRLYCMALYHFQMRRHVINVFTFFDIFGYLKIYMNRLI